MKTSLLTLVFAVLFISLSFGQKKDVSEIKYRRSSLHTILMEANFPKRDTVIKAYNNAPFPDKYNNHTIGSKSFNPVNYLLNDAEKLSVASQQSKTQQFLKATAEDNPNEIFPKEEIPHIITKYLETEKMANKLVAKWFNRQENGAFDMNLIGERGSYNASDMEANIAKGSARSLASLADAGEELIKNTFVVVSKLMFVDNTILAESVKATAYATAESITNPTLQAAAYKAADRTYEKTKEGYSVWTTAFLYQLEWNDSIANTFYYEMWMDENSIDPLKKEAFDTTSLFSLKFVGQEKARSLVTFSLTESRTESEIIELATIRNIDAVYSKLQKKYDVFKTKTPLYTGNPITAKIGMKEGLEGGEKFEVLEQELDPITGLTIYRSKGTITVDKKSIWDNRYNAGSAKEKDENGLSATKFKGGKKFYSGMLIRQLR